MLRSFRFFSGILLLATLFGHPVLAQETAGQVERLKGTASREAGTETEVLTTGSPVYVGDTIVTGAGGRLLIRLNDDAELSLGENARITIDEMIYSPEADDPSVQAQSIEVLVGVFRFTSGQIARLSSQAVTVDTPVATIGIRGTEFIGGELTVGMPPGEAHYGFQIAEGAISVDAPGGSVVLDEPGEGTFLPLTGVEAPTPPSVWGAAAAQEVTEALAF